eukprot:m.11391 g.11391  ORF g.11391 m.11391 type:complete len:388 (+) comp23251_c0_seq2:29-1192(+)
MALIHETDVFETPDPVVPNEQTEDDTRSESVDVIDVDVQASYDRFKDSVLDSRRSNFSDAVGRARNKGYDVRRQEFELLPDDEHQKETLQQKYQRLKLETEELLKEISSVKEVEESMKSSDVSPLDLASQIAELQGQLSEDVLEKVLGHTPGQTATDRELTRQLNAELQSFKEKPSTTGDGYLTYELYYRPEHEKFAQMSKAAELEQRLSSLEALVGVKELQTTSFVDQGHSANAESLTASVASLQEKISLLDLNQIDQIEARLQSVLYQMTQIAGKKEMVNKAKEETKVDDLYGLVKKWDHVASSLPDLVGRLESLQELHQQAVEFSQSVTYLDAAQQKITSQLETDGHMLTEVKKTFEKNTSSIVANCEALEQRMAALLAKVSAK